MLPHLRTTGHGTVSASQGETAREVGRHMLYARGDPSSCSTSSLTAAARDHPPSPPISLRGLGLSPCVYHQVDCAPW